MRNIELRKYAMEKRVNLWEVSEALGYSHESSLSRILRHELPDKKKEEVMKIIDELAESREV